MATLTKTPFLSSWQVGPFASATDADPTYRTYTHSLNPPILHRKELLVPPSHPSRSQWCELTAEAEALGLFDDTRAIGFRLNWQRLIQQRGYQLVGKALLPIGNDTKGNELADPILESNGAEVQRHLTALHRASLSAPVQLLIPPRATQPRRQSVRLWLRAWRRYRSAQGRGLQCSRLGPPLRADPAHPRQ